MIPIALTGDCQIGPVRGCLAGKSFNNRTGTEKPDGCIFCGIIDAIPEPAAYAGAGNIVNESAIFFRMGRDALI